MLRLELVDISKQYPAVKANDSVNLQVQPGEIHAVLGENGAGKSTLTKMIAGAVAPTSGEILLEGKAIRFANPAETLVRRNKTDSSFRCFSVTLIARSLLMGTSLFQILYHYVAEFSLFPYLGEGVLRDAANDCPVGSFGG